ncbi:hypothetical protein H5410_059255 [Solanum commersonii]|uniref:Uncharacterized protein n=1 Tax=Solanum commersonii TaxID=4109 RepID=A0A9J5W246_SOLCO|nr:hypothetical protein H5410_059255 [Solanum commersonii]
MTETITKKTHDTTHNFKHNNPGAPEVNKTVRRETSFTFLRAVTETDEQKRRPSPRELGYRQWSRDLGREMNPNAKNSCIPCFLKYILLVFRH